MAEKQHETASFHLQHIAGKTIILASTAGLIIGGPLLCLMGFTFLATTTLLLITSPLFILFSPLLFGTACVLCLAMLGFAAAGAMAVVGVSMVARVARAFTGTREVEYYGGDEVMKEKGNEYLEQRAHNPHEINVMRG